MSYSSLKDCVRQVATGTPWKRTQAEETLRQWGRAAVPDLLQALEAELNKPFTLTADPMLRLAELLSEFGDPSSLHALARIMFQVGGGRYNQPFLRCSHVLKVRAESEDIVALIEEVRYLRAQPLLAAHIVSLVKELVAMAEHNPCTEFQALLPIVRQSYYAPFVYPQLYRRLSVALGNDSLPIPATAVRTTEHLPIPAEDEMR